MVLVSLPEGDGVVLASLSEGDGVVLASLPEGDSVALAIVYQWGNEEMAAAWTTAPPTTA